MCSRWTAAHRSAEHPYWIRWMSMTGQRAGGTIEQNRSRSRQSKERGEVDMSIDDHTVLRTTPRSVCCLVLLFVIVTLNTACRMRDIAMSNVKHEARVVWCVLVGRGGAAPWAARGQPSWGARAGGAAAGRFGPFAHSGRSRSRARSSSAKQRVLRAAPLAAGEISDPGRNTRGVPAEADPRVFGFWAFRISGRIPISRGFIFTSRTFLHSSSLFGRLALSPCPVRCTTLL